MPVGRPTPDHRGRPPSHIWPARCRVKPAQNKRLRIGGWRAPFSGTLEWRYRFVFVPESDGTRVIESYTVTEPLHWFGWFMLTVLKGSRDRRSEMRASMEATLDRLDTNRPRVRRHPPQRRCVLTKVRQSDRAQNARRPTVRVGGGITRLGASATAGSRALWLVIARFGAPGQLFGQRSSDHTGLRRGARGMRPPPLGGRASSERPTTTTVPAGSRTEPLA
jgi:hypothetical protein